MANRKQKQINRLFAKASCSGDRLSTEILFIIVSCTETEIGSVESSVAPSAKIVIKRSQDRVPADAAGEFSSPWSTF